jgi:hypothetical protein
VGARDRPHLTPQRLSILLVVRRRRDHGRTTWAPAVTSHPDLVGFRSSLFADMRPPRDGLRFSMRPLDSETVDRPSWAHPDRPHQRTAGWLTLAAGGMFIVTVGYLFGVMSATGWTIAMFDAPADLLVWINGHERIYQGLWVLYFLSQTLLLAVPVLLSGGPARATAVFGTAAVVLAMVGLVVIFAVSPVLAHAYHEATTTESMSSAAGVLVLHDVMADVGKNIRLFSELLLGVWLILLGRQLRGDLRQRRWWGLVGLGCWTVAVAAIKLLEPATGLEDWLGFLLGGGYVAMGVGLLRRRRPDPQAAAPPQ